MKNKIISFIVFSLILCSLVSCFRKEKEDPFISLRSRKARVVGNWTADEGSVSISNTNWYQDYTIRGNNYSYADPSGYSNGTASVAFVFKHNGDCNISINLGGFISEYIGSWNFCGGIGSYKSKTQIIIHPTSYTDGTGQHTVDGNLYDLTYDIVELRNKEMKLHLTEKNTDQTSFYTAYTETWTLKQ